MLTANQTTVKSGTALKAARSLLLSRRLSVVGILTSRIGNEAAALYAKRDSVDIEELTFMESVRWLGSPHFAEIIVWQKIVVFVADGRGSRIHR
jgi:hypothetical protein